MPTRRHDQRLEGRLLAIDFDFFFPNPSLTGTLPHEPIHLYDWGHQESILYRDLIWPARAAGFAASGHQLPRCTGFDEFWNRFHLRDTTLLVADSNGFAGELTPPGADGFRDVLLFDAHHDSGYQRTLADYTADGRYTCEDWTYRHFVRGSRISVRYPLWLPDWRHRETPPHITVERAGDDGRAIPGVFETVFCCRSGSWVPSWCDDQWQQFLSAFPGDIHVLDPVLRQTRWTTQSQHDFETVLHTIAKAIPQPESGPDLR